MTPERQFGIDRFNSYIRDNHQKAARYDRSWAISFRKPLWSGRLRYLSIKPPGKKPTALLFGIDWTWRERWGLRSWDFRFAAGLFYFDIGHNVDAHSANGSIMCALANRVTFSCIPALENADGGQLHRWCFFRQWGIVTEEELLNQCSESVHSAVS